MDSHLSRRDFLKITGLLPLGLASAPLMRMYHPSQLAAGGEKNVLIIVFDAFSAYHISLYGYARQTTPNLARLAERAIVYHNHYAASDFTTPGTASLLTGALPWAHRAFLLGGMVSPQFAEKTVFRAFSRHHRVVYSHNPWVYTLCNQFTQDLDQYVPQSRLLLTGHGPYDYLFARDTNTADVAWERAMEKTKGLAPYSLFLSLTRAAYLRNRLEPLMPDFPLGVPVVAGNGYFLLEDAVDWLQTQIDHFPRPYLGYFHLMPPHDPYSPPKDFYRYFARDGFLPPVKPVHLLAPGDSNDVLLRLRREYDEFILYVDREFGRLFDQLESSGALDSTWIIMTSDHGELFERGFLGHKGPLLYEPVIRTPLLIFEPGRKARVDIHTPTSAVDLLPTLLHVTGQDPVDWTEGSVLPPFVPPVPDRPVFALYVSNQDARMPIMQATAVIAKGRYKLMYMFGYPKLGNVSERVELYDLQLDPEELVDLSSSHRDVAGELLQEVKARIREADQRYL